MATDTVWVLGDQLDERLAHLADRDPSATTVLLVVSRSKLESRRWGRQRAHFYIASMRRFAERLRSLGFTVDWRIADSMRAGMEDHIAEYGPRAIVAMEPANRAGFHLLERLGVRLIPSDQFLCHRDEFRGWAEEHRRRDGSLLMEDFYRWQRRRLDILIEEDGSPVGGRWNLDEENRL
ncbi:MAG: cryptochrome/photolyase family protein, partial [Ilumatobacteraceae bacterium]